MKNGEFDQLIIEGLIRPYQIIELIKNKEIQLDYGTECYILGVAYSKLGLLEKAEGYIKESISRLEDEIKVISAYIEMGSIKSKSNKMLDGMVWFYSALEKSYIIDNMTYSPIIMMHISFVLLFYNMKKEAVEITENIDLKNVKENFDKSIYSVLLLNMSRLNYECSNIEFANKLEKIFHDEFTGEKTQLVEINEKKMLFEKNIYYKNIEECRNLIEWLDENVTIETKKLKYKIKFLKLLRKVEKKENIINMYKQILDQAIVEDDEIVILSCIEELYAMNRSDLISKELCITMFLREAKKFNEEKQSLMNFTINNISEKLMLKRNLLNRKNKISELSNEISELKVESVKDGLTGAFNRLYLDSFDVDKIRKRFFTIAFMDLDNFKLVNDTRGHIFGDRVLVEISNSIEYLLGNKGKLIRFGGDEFIIFYEHNDIGDGLELVKEIHKDMNSLSANRYSKYNISISAGSLTIEKNRVKEKSIYKYIEECDKLMYKVKGNSKNNFIHKYIC